MKRRFVSEIVNGWEIIERWTEKVYSKTIGKYDIHSKVKAKCPKCKNIIIKESGSLRTNKQCIDCRFKEYCPFGDVPVRYYSGIKSRAIKERNMEFTVDLEYIDNKFKEQNGKCVYSGRPLQFTRSYKKRRVNQTASLDRIDSSKGYIKGNVQWVHKDINWTKSDMSHKDFIFLCDEISNYQRRNTYEG